MCRRALEFTVLVPGSILRGMPNPCDNPGPFCTSYLTPMCTISTVLWYCVVMYVKDSVFVPQEQGGIPFQNTTFPKLFGPNVTCRHYSLGAFSIPFYFLHGVGSDNEKSSE